MNEKELKDKIDFNRIEETTRTISKVDFKETFIIDDIGNKIIRLSPLEVKLIEEIKALKIRIGILEKR